jgi:hypothetical protein
MYPDRLTAIASEAASRGATATTHNLGALHAAIHHGYRTRSGNTTSTDTESDRPAPPTPGGARTSVPHRSAAHTPASA